MVRRPLRLEVLRTLLPFGVEGPEAGEAIATGVGDLVHGFQAGVVEAELLIDAAWGNGIEAPGLDRLLGEAGPFKVISMIRS